jgi:hypothetical protein
MQIDLDAAEAAALLKELNALIESARYPLSSRIQVLRSIRDKLPGAPPSAPPARPITPAERNPNRRPRSGSRQR